tara:strand:- start:542 stop:1333 length:792 start_codon:yes stop_codon:yes gene_type:complete
MIIIFMVAGMSSRFGSKIKQMAQIGKNGETLIEISVNQAICTGLITKIIFITNHLSEMYFKNLFGEIYKNIDIEYIQQEFDTKTRIRPWGTIGAICELKNKITEPFIVLNGDDLYGEDPIKNGINFLIENKNNKINIIGGCKLLNTLPEDGTVNRGIIEIEGGYVTELKEIINISNKNIELYDKLANVNFIGLHPYVLELLFCKLEEFKKKNSNNPKIECLLPNVLNELIHYNNLKMKYFEITNKIYGITNPDDAINLKNMNL